MQFLKNTTFVRPANFIISGFVGIPNIRYYFVFLCFIYIFSVVGNTAVMLIIIFDHTLRSPKYIAVFNLAFTDLLSNSALVPKVLDISLFNHHYISYNNCLTFMFFCFTLISMQAFNLVVLSFDRIMAIMYPLHYQMRVSHKIILSLITFFWLLAIALTGTAVGLLTRLHFCESVVINSYYSFVLWLPLIFVLGSYCCIGYSLSRISTCKERVKALKTCTGHLSLVAIYFIPILVVYTSVMPPMLNPIIYVLQTAEIKKSLKRSSRTNLSTLYLSTSNS
uniref:G-protein coupled receptors family 1 profile domain-containing protein n=1 Tax=Oreochromis aureus TaxID=47969 RepID=A0AAZ1X1H1_OREAU